MGTIVFVLVAGQLHNQWMQVRPGQIQLVEKEVIGGEGIVLLLIGAALVNNFVLVRFLGVVLSWG